MRWTFRRKLMLAFSLAVLVSLALALWGANLSINAAFNRFNESLRRVQAQELSGFLRDYYARNGSWTGIQALLARAADNPRLSRGQPILLADPEGRVVASSAPDLRDSRLSRREIQDSIEIAVEGETVGRVYIRVEARRLPPLEAQFSRAMNRAIVLAALAALALALLLAGLFARRIVRPLAKLRAANRAVSEGRLDTRVTVRTADEFGELSRSFNEMTAALERLERNRRDMVADVAHELRTPIAALQANLEALHGGALERSAENVTPLLERTRQLSRLVDDLHTLALAEAGQLGLYPEPIEVGDLIGSALKTYAPMAEEKSVQLRAHLPDETLTHELDPDRMSQVLGNLLSNALRHTPADGWIEVGLASEGDALEIGVTDSGPGLSDDEMAHAFERFWRSDRARSRAEGGAGLGLSIAKHLVQAHGGTIRAERAAGGGARFVISLP